VKEGRSRAESKQERSSSVPPDTVRARKPKGVALGWDSGAVEGTSIVPKPSPFARRRRTAVLAGVAQDRGSLQPLLSARHRRPGCPGAAKRRGIGRKRPILRSLLPTRSFVVKRGSRPTASARASGSFFTGDPGSRSRRLGASRASEGGDHASVIHVRPRAATRERGARDREDRGSLVRHGRGSAARGTCSWVVSGCRSRRASPTVQRSVRPPLPKPNEVGADGT